jgi:hypothetical protein
MRRTAIGLIAWICTALLAGCASEDARPVYGPDSRLLERIDYDTDRNGRVDARLYFSQGRPARLEVDANADGLVERWELYSRDGNMEKLGTSSLGDGRVDTWVTQADNTMTFQMSTRRDGVIDRNEVHEGGLLRRLELDTNRDGRPDQWQRFEGGRVAEVAFDTTLQASKPDRRLIYGRDGTVARVEADIEGNGRFTKVPGADR